MLTLQEMFDKAVRGLYRQGWAQAMDDNTCVYEAADGKRCAWGHVDTGLAHPDNKGGSVYNLEYTRRGIAASLPAILGGLRFAGDLQAAHDNGGDPLDPARMIMRLKSVAERYGLTWPSDVPTEHSNV